MMNDNFCSITFHYLLYNDIMVSHKLLKLYKQYPCSILSLFVVLNETIYDGIIISGVAHVTVGTY